MIVLSLSGGIDSAVVLAGYLEQGMEVECVFFTYGSKHNEIEKQSAMALAKHYQVPLHFIDITPFMKGFNSSMLDERAIPEGHYKEDTMKSTVVPCRNLIFASILAGIAECKGANFIGLGVHAGDHFIYPDCRPKFVEHLNRTVLAATDHKVGVSAPILHKDKIEIVAKGISLNLPFHLTRTCYTDNPVPCGKCGSCVERNEAFRANGIVPFEEREN